jgi:chlorite dismutase
MQMDIQRASPSKQVDISEKGRAEDGTIISLNRRLFVQLLAFGKAPDSQNLVDSLEAAKMEGALYDDLNDPYGIALLTFSEDPVFFVTTLRRFLRQEPFSSLVPKPEYTMMGRTYSIGYETDLERTLISRPIERLTDPMLPWAIWYPLRRSGQFEQLPSEEQRKILMEHGGIGRSYGEAGLAHDIRLACHGLNKEDNDFVIGLLGRELHPLSRIVERMRKTKQTSQYLTNLGPFFIGKVVWQNREI